MRITNGIMAKHLMTNLNSILNRMDKVQNQLASGRTINKPSDNPTGTARSMQLNTNLVETSQYIINTDYSISWCETAESAFSNVTEVMQRARELAVQGANGVLAQDSRDAIANEIEQLRQQIIDLGNASNGGRYVFGGYQTVDPPFKDLTEQEQLDLSMGNIILTIPPSDNNQISKSLKASDPTNINGNTPITINAVTIVLPDVSGDTNETALDKIAQAITTEMGANNQNFKAYMDKVGDQVRIRFVSDKPFTVTDGAGANFVAETSYSSGSPYKKEITDIIGYNGDNSKIYVEIGAGVKIDINVPGGEPFASNIAALTNLRNALRAGDQTRIGHSLIELDRAIDITLTNRSDLGARTNRLELVKSRLEDLDLNFNKLLSNNEDTDVAGTIMDLKMLESVQRSALAVGSKVIVPTLVDFLR